MRHGVRRPDVAAAWRTAATGIIFGVTDDDDWVGTPPEGRYTRDRAKPEFWWRQHYIAPTAVGIGIVLIVLLIVLLL
jgi:hypothetical protein